MKIRNFEDYEDEDFAGYEKFGHEPKIKTTSHKKVRNNDIRARRKEKAQEKERMIEEVEEE